jgi:hypothetical protein
MTAPVAVVRRPAYLLLPLVVGAVIAVALGVYAMKVWLSVAAGGFALFQGLTALWMYGRLGGQAPG